MAGKMVDSMRILVTGAAGFIGSHLTERLLSQGHTVYGLDNFDEFYDPSIKRRNLVNCLHQPNFTLIEADILDRERLAAIFELYSFDLIIHLAAMAGVRPSLENPHLYTRVNVIGSQNLLEQAAKHGIKPFIFASSSSVYGANQKLPFSEDDRVENPISPYATTKRAGELLCYNWHHIYNMSIVCLRFFTVYGPRQRPDLAIHSFSRKLMRGEAITVYGDGSSSRDYTYVSDTVDGIVASIDYCISECRYEIINLGEAQTISLSAMISYLEELSGKQFVKEYKALPPGDLLHTNADISKAKALLGYDPKLEFKTGIRLWWEWFRALEQEN